MVSTPTSVPVSAEEIVETARGLKEQMDSIKAVIGSSRVDWDNSELQALQSDWNEAMSAVNTVLRTSSAVGTSPELANKMNKHVDTVKKVYEVINQLAPEIGNLMSDTQGAISGLGGALSNIFEGMTPKNLAEMAAERGGRIANYFGLHPGNKTKLASNLMEKTGEETAKMDYNEAARAREATKMYDIRPQEILYKIGRNKDRIDSFYSQILGMKGLSAAGENEAALIMSTQGKIERNSTDIQTKEGEKSTAETRLGDLEQREVDLGELKGKKDAFENGKVMDGSSEWNHDSAVEENQNQIKKIKDTDIPALTGEITQLKANDGNLKSQLQQQQTMAEKNRSERNAEKNNSEVAKLSVEEMQFANEQIAALKKENTSLEIDYNVLTMPGFKPKATWIMHKTKNAVMDALTADVTKDSAKWFFQKGVPGFFNNVVKAPFIGIKEWHDKKPARDIEVSNAKNIISENKEKIRQRGVVSKSFKGMKSAIGFGVRSAANVAAVAPANTAIGAVKVATGAVDAVGKVVTFGKADPKLSDKVGYIPFLKGKNAANDSGGDQSRAA